MKFLIIAFLLIVALMIWFLMRANTIYKNKNPDIQKLEDEEQMKAIQSNKNRVINCFRFSI